MFHVSGTTGWGGGVGVVESGSCSLKMMAFTVTHHHHRGLVVALCTATALNPPSDLHTNYIIGM